MDNKGDVAMEDDAVVDGTVVVEAAKVLRNRPELAYSVTTVASTDTMLHSVLEEPAHLVAIILFSLWTSEAILLRFEETVEEIEETDEAVATGEPVSRVSMLSIMLKTTNILLTRIEICRGCFGQHAAGPKFPFVCCLSLDTEYSRA